MSFLNWRSVVIGLLATITMDIFSFTALKLGWIAFLPPRLTGRWFASMAHGQFLHRDIAQAPSINHEAAVAVPMHYLIGITLALLYLLISSSLGLAPRNPLAALGFALCSNLLPWLLMFPAMGYGWFGAHGPQGTRLFVSSLVTHGFYGIGLWFGASMLSRT
jgi:hypothetical protein